MSSRFRHVAVAGSACLLGFGLIVTAAAPAAALLVAPRPTITCPLPDMPIVRKRTLCGMNRPACA